MKLKKEMGSFRRAFWCGWKPHLPGLGALVAVPNVSRSLLVERSGAVGNRTYRGWVPWWRFRTFPVHFLNFI